MNKILSSIISLSLILAPFKLSAAAIAKSEQQADSKPMPKPKNIDKVYGEEGKTNESKSALISVDALALQNYSMANNIDFSTYDKVPLKTVILETLSQSNDLKSANEKVIQARLQYKDAFSAYLPTVDFAYVTKKTHNFKTGDKTTDTLSHMNFNDEDYKFTLRQSVYTGGATEFKIKSLESKLEEAKRKYTIVLEQEIQKAIKAYFDVLFAQQSVIANTKNMEKLNKILEITQIKYDSGALSIGDLSAVKANIANASGKLIKVKSDLADAIDFYLYTVGEDFVKTMPYEENFTLNLTTIDDLYVDLIENNLGLMNYRLNIQSTKDKLLNMKSTFKPKVDFEVNYKNVLDKEAFKANEESYDAKLTLSYNIYNGGKDTIATMDVFSSLQELNYRYLEEVKKEKWTVSKLFNSIKSLEDTMGTTKKEVAASRQMVDSYWEGFQLGEQDLQVLLQGQRQLNGVELDLIKYKQDHLTNVFKLLSEKGELSKYFAIDSTKPDFIDFTNTAIIKQAIPIDLSKDKNQNDTNKTNENNTTVVVDSNGTIKSDLNTTIDEYLEVVNEASFKDIINFKDKFLEANDNNYTIVISDFTNHYDAYNFMKKNRLLDKAFSYEFLNKNGDFTQKDSKTKIVDVKTNIAFGVYNSIEEANADTNNIFDKTNKVLTVVKIKDIKELYNTYVNGLETKIDPFVIVPVKPKVIKTFMTNPELKNKFLSAPASFFSINVVSLSQITQAENLVKSEKIEKDSFVFKYGRNGEWVKVMLGVFPTYTAAIDELNKHPELIKKYSPVIEKIGQKQELFNKYTEFNGTPQWFLDEQKEKKETKEKPIKKEKKEDKKSEIAKSQKSLEIKQEKILKQADEPVFEVLEVLKPQTEQLVAEIKTDDKIAEKTPNIMSIDNLKNDIQMPNVSNELVLEQQKVEVQNNTAINEMSKSDNENQNKSDARIDTNTPLITSEIKNDIETTKTSFNRENFKSFKNAFENAPKEYYTMEFPAIATKDKDAFIKRFIIGNQFTEISKNGKTRIFFELFEDLEKARAQKLNLHPLLIDKVKLMRLGRITK